MWTALIETPQWLNRFGRLKGAEIDEQCDDVAAIIALGEDEAKDLIRLMYQEEIRQRRK